MLAIIGTAGRGEDKPKLTLQKWNQAKRLVLSFVQDNKVKELVSGGAPWADQMAVQLFNKKLVNYLVLALPCPFITDLAYFIEAGPKSPGAVINHYHKEQSKVCGINTLLEINSALSQDAEVIVADGFLERNKVVAARADGVLAITFGEGKTLNEGGTAQTMRNFIERKTNKYAFHLDLNSMQIYQGAVCP